MDKIEISDQGLERLVSEKFMKMGIKLTPCKKCSRLIFFLETKKGKQMPVTLTLMSHFIDCPAALEFKKPNE